MLRRRHQPQQILVDPAIAAAWLATCGAARQRPTDPAKIQAFVVVITSGQWRHGSTICLDVAGRLLDGQHRLLAIVTTGVAVQMTVIRGISAASRCMACPGACERRPRLLRASRTRRQGGHRQRSGVRVIRA